MNRFFGEIVDRVMNLREDLVAIRHYNNLEIEEKDISQIREDYNDYCVLYKNFHERGMFGPYDPLLGWVYELCQNNEIELKNLIKKCKVYSLHKEIFLSYYTSGISNRPEPALLNEIQFEKEKFVKEIADMFLYLAEKKPICMLLENVSMASYSTLEVVYRIMKNKHPNIHLICSYNENDSEVEYTKEIWGQIVDYWDKKDILLDIIQSEDETAEANIIGFNFSSELLEDYYIKLSNSTRFMCFEQAEYYLDVIYHKFEVEKIDIDAPTKFNFLELYSTVTMLKEKGAEALLYLNRMETLLSELEDDQWKIKYHAMASQIYMNSFQQELATLHINKAKKLIDKTSDDKTKFWVTLLEHMVFFQGWRDIWLLNTTIPGLEPLIEGCRKYGFVNHLAHIYVYAYDNERERYSNLAGLNIKMPHFLEGMKIARKLGNYQFMIEAYKKNVLRASTSGYYGTANYFNDKIKDICIKHELLIELAYNYNGMGYNCSVIEEYEQACDYYNRALEIFMESDDVDAVNETIYNLAFNAMLAMEYKTADDLFKICLRGVKFIKANSVSVCNISKIYGLRAFCNYALGQYYNTMINLQYVEQFLGHIIVLEEQNIDAPHLWDDDLAIFYTVSAMMDEKNGLYEASYEKLLKGRKFVDRAEGSRFALLLPYAIVLNRVARIIGDVDTAEEIILEAKKFCRENNLKKRSAIIEQIVEGKAPESYGCNLGIKLVKADDVIDKAEYAGISRDSSSKRKDLEFLGIWQKVLSGDIGEPNRILENAFMTLMNQYNIDDFLYIRMEDDKPVMKFKVCDEEFDDETLMYIKDFFIKNRSAFKTSRIDKGYNKYKRFINKCFGFNSISTFIAVPIFLNEKLDSIFIATVQMNMEWSYKSKRYIFDNDDLRIFTMLYHNVVDYVKRVDAQREIATANKRLQKMAVKDQLTGICNRQGMYELFDKASDKIAVIYADLDNFKFYNDTYGHHIGDVVLVEFAKLLQEVTDQKADAVRYGGDEFLLVMYEDDKSVVEETVKRIYQRLEESKGLEAEISGSVNKKIKIPREKWLSCSIGIAMGNIEGEEEKRIKIEKILKDADTAMYKVKHSTKHSYVFFDER